MNENMREMCIESRSKSYKNMFSENFINSKKAGGWPFSPPPPPTTLKSLYLKKSRQ